MTNFRILVQRPSSVEDAIDLYKEPAPLVYPVYSSQSDKYMKSYYHEHYPKYEVPHCPILTYGSNYSSVQPNKASDWRDAMRQIKLVRGLGFEIGSPVLSSEDGRKLGDKEVDWDAVGWVEQFMLWRQPNVYIQKPLLVRWNFNSEETSLKAHYASELWLVDYETNKVYDPWTNKVRYNGLFASIPCHTKQVDMTNIWE